MDKINLTDTGADMLLDAMLRDCKIDFENGALLYIEADRELRTARNKISNAMRDYAKAYEKKYRALNQFIPEYAFLMSKETVQMPTSNTIYIVRKMLLGVLDSITEELTATAAALTNGED